MAGDVRIYYLIDDKEYSVELWLDTDHPDKSDREVLEAVLNVAPPGRGASILRVLDLGTEGKPVIYDEYLIKNTSDIEFGMIFKKVGHEGWFYLPDANMYQKSSGTKIHGNTLTVQANFPYVFADKHLFPVKAVIDWDRRSLRYGDNELYLFPFSP